MAQSQPVPARVVPAAEPPLSPLFLSDRLIALAEQAGKLGCTTTAKRLIRLASTVLDETSAPPPPTYCAG